ncbi:hypothetical protein RRG08_033411 [Elysia crispata]|uniref:Uncharacterized protein n=1 Tax=Elysia crispata TaxID=231223 RepID=A0AAE1A157_9GAST|nr:hypothetical protein RRG08_033411 [Elysia crispata]
MADFDRPRVDVARGVITDETPLIDFTRRDYNITGSAETSFNTPPEDVWEAQNETPSWAASSVPAGVSQEDHADAQHTKALVDRWRRERGEVQQKLEFASSTKGDLWLRWGKKWLLLTNKNKPGEFLAPSTIKRYRVDVAKALGVYKSTGLSTQDSGDLNKAKQQVGEAASDIETAPLEDLGQTIIKAEAAVQIVGNILAVPERPGCAVEARSTEAGIAAIDYMDIRLSKMSCENNELVCYPPLPSQGPMDPPNNAPACPSNQEKLDNLSCDFTAENKTSPQNCGWKVAPGWDIRQKWDGTGQYDIIYSISTTEQNASLLSNIPNDLESMCLEI